MALSARSNSLAIFRQYMTAFIASLTMLMIGMSTAWPSPVLPLIISNKAPVTMDNSQISWMVSIMFLGNTLSPIPTGALMDRFGRKQIMYSLNILPFSAWILTYYGKYAWQLYVARFFNGIWAGTCYTVCAVYIGEIAEPSIRGSLSNFNNLSKTVGGLCVFIVGPYISFESLALLCGLVPTLFFFAGTLIPESPYFLLMRNRKQEAKQALSWLRGNKEELNVQIELVNMEKAVIAQTQLKGSFKDIFTNRAYRRGFTIALILCFVKTLSGFDVMMAYTSTTLPKKAFQSLGPNECVIILGVVSVVTCVGSIFILDKFPRRFLLSLSSIGCAITTFLAGSWFLLNDKLGIDVQPLAQLPFYCFAFHAVVYSIGLGPIVASVKGEMFSANVKGLCSALTTVIYAILNFMTAKMYLNIAGFLGMYLNYYIYSVGCALGTVFILIYVVETRGKSLHEIQIKLSQKKGKPVTLSVITT